MSLEGEEMKIEFEKIKNRTIIYRIIIPRSLKRYFLSNRLHINYNFDLQDIPRSILTIPAVGYLLPLAFATGKEIFAETLDRKFYESVNSLRFVVKKIYPKLPADGVKINVKKLVRNDLPKCNNKKKAVFFSGGIDSTSLLLEHINEKPVLITVWGSDIKLNEKNKWLKFMNYTKLIASKCGLEHVKITFNDIIDQSLLTSNFIIKLGHRWWDALAAGITFPALAAPLVNQNIRSIYMASSVPVEVYCPTSIRFDIINAIQIANLKIICDDYKLSRYQKVLQIKKNLDKAEKYGFKLKIRSCGRATSLWNCGYCEKCARTIIMLMLAGLNPNKVGFNIDIREYPKYIKESFDRSYFRLNPASLYYWLEIKRLSKRHPDLKFLALYDFRKFTETKKLLLLGTLFSLINRIFGINTYKARRIINRLCAIFPNKVFNQWKHWID